MDETEWRDVQGMLAEWNENPPVDLFARAYFGYEARAAISEGDKFFGDDKLPDAAKRHGAPIETAPPEIQAVFEHFKKSKVTSGS